MVALINASGGFGTTADGTRAKIQYQDKSLEITADNKVTIFDTTGQFTKEIEIGYDEYTTCLRDLITLMGLDRPTFVTIEESYDRWPKRPSQIVDGLRGIIAAASSTKDGAYVYVNATLVIENVSNISQKVAMIGSYPLAIDNKGLSYDFWRAAGITMCGSFKSQHAKQCKTLHGSQFSISPSEYTIVPIGGFITIPMEFYRQTHNSAGSEVTVSAQFVRLDDEGENLDSSTGVPQSVNFGIPNIRLER